MKDKVNVLINEVINNPVILSIEPLLDTYEVTKTLSIVSKDDKWFYLVRYNGSPNPSENESIFSWEFKTAVDAAKAAIKKFKIINVRYGCAVLAPTKEVPPTPQCRNCEWYSQEAKRCAVNPLNLGKAEKCGDFSLPPVPARNTPKPIRLGQLGKALIKCGLVK